MKRIGAMIVKVLRPAPLDAWVIVTVLYWLLTGKQMADVCQSVQSLGLSGAKLPAHRDGSAFQGQMVFEGDLGGIGLPEFMDAYLTPGNGVIHIQSEIPADVWKAMARNNQARQFRVLHESLLPGDAFATCVIGDQASLRGIVLYRYEINNLRDALNVLKTDMQIPQLEYRRPTIPWDVAFGIPEAKQTLPDLGQDSRSFLDRTKDYHWAYGWNQNDQVTHLWLPGIDQVIKSSGDMTAVRVLRFDRRGFMGMQSIHHLDFGPLGKVPSVERLYLPSGEIFKDLRFLAKLPKLRHLQIQAQNRKRLPFNGYEVCQNLESIRIFGTPAEKAIRELATLKNLKRVEIIDDNDDVSGEADLEAIETQLPNVDVKIIAPEDFEPDMSEDFRNHLRRIRERVNAQL